jgi:hypothetical protein
MSRRCGGLCPTQRRTFILHDEIQAGLDFVEPHRCAEDEIPAGVDGQAVIQMKVLKKFLLSKKESTLKNCEKF